MKVHWWRCMLGFLCMPAEVMLYSWTVSQSPSSLSFTRATASVEITCSTSLSDPGGLYLYRQFHDDKKVTYLSLRNGKVSASTTAREFTGRIHVTSEQRTEGGHGFTLRLSQLGLNDTDFYYCSWTHFAPQTGKLENKRSIGTVIIITENDPHHHCRDQIWDSRTLICLTAAAVAGTLLLIIGALILRCRKFKKHFRPARAEKPLRPRGPQRVCPQHRTQHTPYMVTSVQTLDFRGIL